jgi:hypothetical protein
VDLFPLTMRTRARTTRGAMLPLVPLTYTRYDYGVLVAGPNVHTGGAQSVCSSTRHETIIDDPSSSRGIKTVSHVIQEAIPVLDDFTSYGGYSQNPRYTGSGASLNQWVLPSGSGFDFPTLTGPYWIVDPNASQDALVRDTVDAFYNMNQVDNLLNIVEAPQLLQSLLSLAATWRQVREYILKYGLLKGYQGLRNNWSAWTIKKKLGWFGRRGRDASGLYLMYSFGIAPLLSDMSKVQREIKTLKAKIQAELRKQSGRLVSVHRSCGYTFSYRNPSTGVRVGFLDNTTLSLRYTGTLDNEKSRRVCTVRGYQTPKYETAAFRRLDYMMARFGVTGPASLAWELIPFSFVVDWFLDLRHITNSLDNLLTGSPKRIVDICMSDKIRWTDTAVLNSGYVPSTQGTVMGRVVNSSYTRNPVLSYNKVGLAGRFGKKQASLTAALLYQQVANLR